LRRQKTERELKKEVEPQNFAAGSNKMKLKRKLKKEVTIEVKK